MKFFRYNIVVAAYPVHNIIITKKVHIFKTWF